MRGGNRDRLRAFALTLALGAAACGAAALSGCSRERDTPGAASDDLVHRAGTDRRVRLKFESGPLGEIVITRDTAGRLVIGGVCYFPDGTRLDVALVDTAGQVISRSQPVIEDAMFTSLPLAVPDTSGWSGHGYDIQLSASFAPGAQAPEVLRQVKPGRAFVGEGMMLSRQGHFAYSRRLRVSL